MDAPVSRESAEATMVTLATRFRQFGQASLENQGSPGKNQREIAWLQNMIHILIGRFPNEILVQLFQFILYPRFLPAYKWKVRNPQTGEGVFQEIPNNDRKAMAVLEVRRLAAAYGGLLLRSRQWHDVASSKQLQLTLYRRWFQTRPQPYWQHVPFIPSSKATALRQVYQAVGFDRAFLVSGIFSKSIPELDVNMPATPGWYSIFLANVLWNYDLGETLRSEMKHSFVSETSENRRSGVYTYDGIPISKDELDGKRWYPLTSAIVASVTILVDPINKTVAVQDAVHRTKATVIDQSKERRLNLAAWIQPHVRKPAKYDTNDWYPELSDYRKFVTRALAAISIIRFPTAVMLHTPGFRDRIYEVFADLSGQRWVWDPALQLSDAALRAVQQPRFSFWPKKGSVHLEGCVLASTQRSGEVLSKRLAMNKYNWLTLEDVAQSLTDAPMVLNVFPSDMTGQEIKIRDGSAMKKFMRPQDVPIYIQPLANTRWIRSATINYITSPQQMPEYLQYYTSKWMRTHIDSWPRAMEVDTGDADDDDDDEGGAFTRALPWGPRFRY